MVGFMDEILKKFMEDLVHSGKIPEGIFREFLVEILEEFQVDILVELKMEILEKKISGAR